MYLRSWKIDDNGIKKFTIIEAKDNPEIELVFDTEAERDEFYENMNGLSAGLVKIQ